MGISWRRTKKSLQSQHPTSTHTLAFNVGDSVRPCLRSCLVNAWCMVVQGDCCWLSFDCRPHSGLLVCQPALQLLYSASVMGDMYYVSARRSGERNPLRRTNRTMEPAGGLDSQDASTKFIPPSSQSASSLTFGIGQSPPSTGQLYWRPARNWKNRSQTQGHRFPPAAATAKGN
jgi:hypothetical protein